MKILIIYNRYQQHGGEDTVFETESSMLRNHGHDVIEFVDDNHRAVSLNKAVLACRTIWSRESYRKIRELIQVTKPDIVHIHNTFFMISPSAYDACRAEKVPVIQTLHNYRMICPAAVLYRDGHVCEECVAKTYAYPAQIHRCYHHSFSQTSVIVMMNFLHHLFGTWNNKIDQYITLTSFGRNKFQQGRFAVNKLIVKPNFIYPDPGCDDIKEAYILFSGRHTKEKGIHTLLSAWDKLNLPLKMTGAGPLTDEIIQRKNKNIDLKGSVSYDDLYILMRKARFQIFPSEWYEGFGLVIIEAFACGTPVITAKTGCAADLVTDHVTGLHFTPGDPQDLAEKVSWAWDHPEEMAVMGKNARREYEEKYTMEKNYDMLMQIYNSVIANYPKKTITR
jgi:glycosyltransferase involved in cell wall biosynthesis